MSPIDDELRTTLSSRTQSVDVSPDFLAGVERKAGRMRRHRIAATVAGSALAAGSLGVGGPLLAASLTRTAPAPSDVATSLPTLAPDGAYVLDPADPWAYRGLRLDELGTGTLETLRTELAARRGADVDAVVLTPLYGQHDEASQAVEVVYVAQVAGAPTWGLARSSESGPEVLVDHRLAPGTTSLPAALPGEARSRLVVVAAPGTTVEYCPTGDAPCSDVSQDGVGRTPLDGDPARDRYRVLDPDGRVVGGGPAPDGGASGPGPQAPDGGPAEPPVGPAEPEAEGPGTGQAAALDTAPYALVLDEPWSYRGPLELQQHPDLGTQDTRLFEQGGAGRGDGTWSDRPLLALEQPDGLSLLVVLHRRGDQAVLTTTWQRQDEAPLQSEQAVRDGQLLAQAFVPAAGGGGLLVAVASPRAGAVETDVPGAGRPVVEEPGLAAWQLPVGAGAGSMLLYAEGDGRLYHSEPARRS